MTDRWTTLAGEDCYLRLRRKPSGHRVLYLSRDAIRRLSRDPSLDELHVALDRNPDDPDEIAVRAVNPRHEYGAKVSLSRQIAAADRITEGVSDSELPWLVDLVPNGARLTGRISAAAAVATLPALAGAAHEDHAVHDDTDYHDPDDLVGDEDYDDD